jgi:regulator of cell morphogenesis and NO signaling
MPTGSESIWRKERADEIGRSIVVKRRTYSRTIQSPFEYRCIARGRLGGMNEPATITTFYEEDHDRLDELFKTFQRLKRSDFAKAKDAFKEFKVGLQRHIVWEEELLFPMWEEKTGMIEDGPTPVMRFEHSQIKQLLDTIHQKVEKQNPETDQEEQALLNLLSSHNRKEERALYPAIDNVTSAEERAMIFSNMNTIPEDRYNTCCGQD